MSGTRIDIRIDDAELREAVARLIAVADDLTPVMDRIGGALVADTQRRFEEGVGPGGTAWPPSIRAAQGGGQTLVDSARLLQSITHAAGPRGVQVGTNVVYAGIHQFGGTIAAKGAKPLTFFVPGVGFRSKRSVNIPARPFLGIDDEQESIIGAEIEAYLEESVPEARA